MAGPMTRAEFHDHAVEAHRLGRSSASHQFEDEGLAGRVVEHVHAPEQESQHEDLPQVLGADGGQQPQDEGQHPGHALGGVRADGACRTRSAMRPPQLPKQQHGQELQGRHQAR